jgi:hypothetical protein
VAGGLGHCTLDGRRRTAPTALGRFHPERSVGLPMAEKSVGGVLPSLTKTYKQRNKNEYLVKDELRRKNPKGTA